MYPEKLNAQVILTMAQLYKEKIPRLAVQYTEFWENTLTELAGDSCTFSFATVHTQPEFAKSVEQAEREREDLLIVLPMTYAPSSAAASLRNTTLPLAIISSSQDYALPVDMDGSHLLANQAMHGVIDLTNFLWRNTRKYHMISGHPEQSEFKEQFTSLLKTAKAAKILRKGNIGRIGEPFAGMLDLTFDEDNLKQHLGFNIVPVGAEILVDRARNYESLALHEFIENLSNIFNVSADFTPEELEASARMALALDKVQSEGKLDAIAMNFIPVVAAGAETLPFLGASNLLAQGIGYAGEADVLTAALTAALSQISTETTFTELYSPDYQRNELLLSHMGECNYALANDHFPVELKAKPFSWGTCLRPAVPVFQMKPGNVVLVSLSETPDKNSFQFLAFEAEVVETPVHPNLTVPYTKIRLHTDIRDFLITYSQEGGTHHLALIYDCDINNILTLGDFCQIDSKLIQGSVKYDIS